MSTKDKEFELIINFTRQKFHLDDDLVKRVHGNPQVIVKEIATMKEIDESEVTHDIIEIVKSNGLWYEDLYSDFHLTGLPDLDPGDLEDEAACDPPGESDLDPGDM